MIKTYSGILKTPTRFVTDDNIELRVYMYKTIYEEVVKLLPLPCYIQVEEDIIKNYVAKEV